MIRSSFSYPAGALENRQRVWIYFHTKCICMLRSEVKEAVMEFWMIWFVFAFVSAVMEIMIPFFNRLGLSAGFSGACLAALLCFPFLWQAVFFLLFSDIAVFFMSTRFSGPRNVRR